MLHCNKLRGKKPVLSKNKKVSRNKWKQKFYEPSPKWKITEFDKSLKEMQV